MPLTTIYGGSPSTRVIGDATAIQQTLHPNAASYLNRLRIAGYSVNANEMNALNNLVWGMATNGILAQMQWFHPCMGNAAAHMALDLFGSTYDITFFGSWTFASTGMKPTTANTANYASFGYVPSTAANLNDSHIGIYIRTNTAVLNISVGAWTPGIGPFFQINTSTSANSANVIMGGSSVTFYTGITDTRGYWLGSRVSSTIIRSYFNGILNVTNTASTTSNTANTITYGARNTGASRDAPSAQEIAVAHGGRSLTPIQAKTLYILIQQFNTALSRQV